MTDGRGRPEACPLTWRITSAEEVAAAAVVFHDELAIPLTAHARQVLAGARAAGESITAVVVEDSSTPERPMAALALILLTRPWAPFPLVNVRLAGDGTADELRLAARDSQAAQVLATGVAHLLDGLPAWRARLAQLPRRDLVASALAARFPTVTWTAGDPVLGATWSADRTPGRWAAKKTRQQVRRARRAADEAGIPWTVDVERDPAAVLAALPEMRSLRRERESHLGRVDALATRSAAARHEAVVRSLADQGVLELWRMRQGDRLLSYLLAGHDGGVMRMLDSRMRPGSEAISPSYLVLGAAVSSWHADPAVTGVDLGRGRTTFKGKWSTTETATDELVLWSHAWLRRADLSVARGAEVARRALRRLRDSSPQAQRAIRGVRQVQTSWRAREGAQAVGAPPAGSLPSEYSPPSARTTTRPRS